MKIIFFGSSEYVIPIIEVLQKNFDLTLVVTTESPKPNLASQVFDPEAQTRRGETLRSYLQSYPVIKHCVENKISYLSVQQFNNLTIQQLKKLNTPVGILASFGAIIPKSVLNIFKYGILNIHPSLLPKYRGPTPVQTAIFNGEKTTGISIIKLDEEIDHGPILVQEKEPIFNNDTSETLYEKLFKKGGEILPNIINKYLTGTLKPVAQNHKNATFTNHLTRQDGFINVDNPPSPELLKCMINAYFPWPSVWTKVQIATPNKQQLTTNNKLDVSAQKLEVRIKFLPGNLIQVEGKKPMSYKDFINGYPSISPVMLNLIQHLERNKT